MAPSPFANTEVVQTVTLTHLDIPQWQPGSFWSFRAEKTDDDEEVMEQMIATWVLREQLSDEEVREAVRTGKDIKPIIASKMVRKQQMSAKRAMLSHMSHPAIDPDTGTEGAIAWGGPDFTLPDDYATRDAKGKVVRHALAGKVPPVTAEWIGKRKLNDETDAVYRILNAVWSGGLDPESFRRDTERVDESGRGRGAAEEVPVSA